MRRETTNDAYKFAAALVSYNIDNGLLRSLVERQEPRPAPEQVEETMKALRRLVASLARQSR